MLKKKVDVNQVLEALKQIQYPGFSKDIVTFGLVKNPSVNNGMVKLTLIFFTETDEMKKQISEMAKEKISELQGVTDIQIDMEKIEPKVPMQPPSAQQKPSKDPAAGRSQIPGVKNIIAVASGKGGVGKSTVSVNLAMAFLGEGAKVGLLDSDVYGPSIPMMLGITTPPQADEKGRIIPIEKNDLKLMSVGFISSDDTPVIWRGPLVTQIIDQFLKNVVWGELDILVVDLPPGTGDAQLTLVQKVPITGVVIVTTPQDISLIDARKGLKMFQKLDVPVFGIVENMSLFICPHCGENTDIFGSGGGKKVSKELDLPLLGQIPIDPRIRIGGDDGHPIRLSHPESEVGKEFNKIAKVLLEKVNFS